MIELTYPQLSPEWHAARVGLLTGSRAGKAFEVTAKGLPTAARQGLILELALERITGESEPVYETPAMRTGIEREPLAREAYERHSGILMREAGLIVHENLKVGTSVDGLTLDGLGALEIKCPGAKKHLEYLQAGDVPAEYAHQVLHHLWVTESEWCDFVSYHPGFPEALQLFVFRMNRDDVAEAMKVHQEGCIALLSEVDAMVDRVLRLAA